MTEQVTSFISFDVEALPGRAKDSHVERLVWGQLPDGEYGIRRISRILGMHKLKGNFLIDFAMCLLYGDKVVRTIIDFLRSEGHEIHAHLHSEWLVRKFNLRIDARGAVFMDRLDDSLTDAMMKFTAWKYSSLTGTDPSVFRAGGYLFSEHTVQAAKRHGFRALSNYNSDRHAKAWQLPEVVVHNDPFLWPNRMLELPVDFSPEPLSFEWIKYQGWFDRAATRKKEKTFNLVMHSWSLMKREGEYFETYAPEHEDRLHQICEHLQENSLTMGYNEYIDRAGDAEPQRLEVHSARSSMTSLEVATRHANCGICGFVFTAVPESDICPGCSGRARHRQLHDVLSRMGNPFDGKIVLANYANVVEQQAFLSNTRSLLNFDIRPVSEVELQMDIQNMSAVRAATCDCFFALHVLNHVKDDELALREIARVLKPGGLACITIPYHESGSTSEAPNAVEHYGQEALDKYGVGTFRRYGLQDASALFAKYFDVRTERGFDTVTNQAMTVFFLQKSGDAYAKRPVA